MGKFSNAALRLTAGALILDAGVKKLKADEGTYAFLQQMAATGVPAVAKLSPATFGKLISGAETTLGATLLTPFIPSRLAGAGLTAFAANLMTMYFRNPDMHDKQPLFSAGGTFRFPPHFCMRADFLRFADRRMPNQPGIASARHHPSPTSRETARCSGPALFF